MRRNSELTFDPQGRSFALSHGRLLGCINENVFRRVAPRYPISGTWLLERGSWGTAGVHIYVHYYCRVSPVSPHTYRITKTALSPSPPTVKILFSADKGSPLPGPLSSSTIFHSKPQQLAPASLRTHCCISSSFSILASWER